LWVHDGPRSQSGLQEEKQYHERRKNLDFKAAPIQVHADDGERDDQNTLDSHDRAVTELDSGRHGHLGYELAVTQWPGATAALFRTGIGHCRTHHEHGKHADRGNHPEPFRGTAQRLT